ncbi:MAG: dehydrogenase, partial [Granulosicoccus sp.]|nr:dehydrogenase [Granulosicoccus sp.]
ATVLELSWYGNRPVTAKLGESFHSRRLQLISSQVGQVAMKQRSRWTSQRRLKFAMSLLADPRLDCLISGESAFESLPETLTRLSDASHDALCHCVRYE